MPKGALRTVRIPPGGFTPALGSLTWELAVPSGLHPSQGSALWQAGHVSALVPLGARDLLVGSHSGGVWHLQPDPSDATRWDALPLSDDWDNPDISALVVESGDHVYAGCFARPQTAVRLYEALPGTGATAGSRSARRRRPAPISARSTRSRSPRASWSAPRAPACGSPRYRRKARRPAPAATAGPRRPGSAGQNPGGLSGLAIAAGDSVVASSLAWRHYHTHTGTSDNLDATVAAVWTSADSGRTWASVRGTLRTHNGAAISPVPLVESAEAGGQGSDWNNCIGVSATDQATVAIGWQNGVFISQNATATDGRRSWSQYDSPPVHHDLHTLVFETRPAAPGRLYIGSDGGLISTDDLGKSYLDGYNTALTDLQFESLPEREFYGLTSASSTVPGLLAGGLQDNGVVWAITGSAGQWEEIMGGDGGGTAFLADGALLGSGVGGTGIPVHLWDWDGSQFTGGAIVPLFGPFGPERPTDPTGLLDPALAAVPPTFQHGGLTLYAVGGNGQEPNVVWGLFRIQDGSVSQWERLATLQADHALWSFASADGTTIYAGVQQQLADSKAGPHFRTQYRPDRRAARGHPAARVAAAGGRRR